MRVWLVLLLSSCVGTPVPIPIPIATKALRVSPSGANVIAIGLDGAVNGTHMRVKNLDTSASRLATVTSSGSFSALLNGEVGHRLLLEALGADGVVAGSLSLAVPKPGLVAPMAQLDTPDPKGRIRVAGTLLQGESVIVTLPRASEVVQVFPSTGGSYLATLQDARHGDTLYVFATDALGAVSQHLALQVVTQSMCMDLDSDGYGRKGTELAGCAFTTADCEDSQGDVNPGQQQFFTTPIPGSPPETDFDYNCDGIEERESAGTAACQASQSCDSHGWQGVVPQCGQPGIWIQCVPEKTGCGEQTQPRTQACR